MQCRSAQTAIFSSKEGMAVSFFRMRNDGKNLYLWKISLSYDIIVLSKSVILQSRQLFLRKGLNDHEGP